MTVLRDASFLWSMLHVLIFFLMFFEPRFPWKLTLAVSFLGAGLMSVVNVLGMLWLGSDRIVSIAFFTCTIPSLLMFFFLSKYRDGRFFFLFCLTDTVSFWLLQLTNLLDRLAGGGYVVLFLSRLVLFPAAELLLWRYLRRPYRELQDKMDRGWWLFAAIGAVYYLLVMATAVPVDEPLPGAEGLLCMALVMALMPLTYLSILLSLWRQMQFYESRWQLESQRQDYEALLQKLEMGRILRHDTRHHLAALEGLLQQGDANGALRYIRSLGGRLEELNAPVFCANSAVNAVLAAYAAQAAEEGCAVDARAQAPEELPYDETDLCVLLANALENAVHACEALPEEQRRVRVELELTENRRLVLSVENPCPEPLAFGPDGLPESSAGEGHGVGLRSVRAVADKYGGLFHCQWEQGTFRLRAVLMPPPEKGEARRVRRWNWTAVVLAALFLLIVLNCVPGLADALEAVPLLGLLVRVVDLRTYAMLFQNLFS